MKKLENLWRRPQSNLVFYDRDILRFYVATLSFHYGETPILHNGPLVSFFCNLYFI